MPTQAEKDTAAAKAKQGGGQAAKDTAAAKAKQNNSNQAAKDTARAKSRQNGGDGGTSARMSQREAAAGLYLAGNDTISSSRGISGPSFFEREVAAGLRDTTTGRDQFYENKSRISTPNPTDWGIHDDNPVTPSAQGGSQGGSGGSGSGFDEEILDIVEAPNTPAQRIFLTKAVPAP